METNLRLDKSAKIFVIRSFFAKNGFLLIFFARQKIINSLASKPQSNFYTFDTFIVYTKVKFRKRYINNEVRIC